MDVEGEPGEESEDDTQVDRNDADRHIVSYPFAER